MGFLFFFGTLPNVLLTVSETPPPPLLNGRISPSPPPSLAGRGGQDGHKQRTGTDVGGAPSARMPWASAAIRNMKNTFTWENAAAAAWTPPAPRTLFRRTWLAGELVLDHCLPSMCHLPTLHAPIPHLFATFAIAFNAAPALGAAFSLLTLCVLATSAVGLDTCAGAVACRAALQQPTTLLPAHYYTYLPHLHLPTATPLPVPTCGTTCRCPCLTTTPLRFSLGSPALFGPADSTFAGGGENVARQATHCVALLAGRFTRRRIAFQPLARLPHVYLPQAWTAGRHLPCRGQTSCMAPKEEGCPIPQATRPFFPHWRFVPDILHTFYAPTCLLGNPPLLNIPHSRLFHAQSLCPLLPTCHWDMQTRQAQAGASDPCNLPTRRHSFLLPELSRFVEKGWLASGSLSRLQLCLSLLL